jgi:hypothetical protein
MKTRPAVYTERYPTLRGHAERRYVVKTVMPLEAVQLTEDIMRLGRVIELLDEIYPDNIREINTVEDRRAAEEELRQEMRRLKGWLAYARKMMREQFSELRRDL